MEKTPTNELKTLVRIQKESTNTGMFNRGFELPLKFSKS